MTDTGQKCYYLEAAPEDIPPLQWALGQNALDPVPGNATATAIGAGRRNTALIVKQHGHTAGFAAGDCTEYFVPGYEKYGDWFLPSKDELKLLFINRSYVDISFGIDYWSSSEHSENYAWSQDFNTGYQNFSNKNGSYSIRPIRAF